jgi:hypothetical protein
MEHVLENVASEQQVELTGGEGKSFEVSALDVFETALAAERDGVGGGIHTGCRAEHSEFDEIPARTAACVEQAGFGREVGTLEKRPDDVATSAEPPVAILEPVHLGVSALLHRLVNVLDC